jgi:hypothetical protein
MLALIVGLLLPPGTPLPDPLLPTSLRPALPVSALQNETPVKVFRGNYWRQGEYQRISFAYRLAPDPNRKVEDVAREKDFMVGSFPNPSGIHTRLVRDVGGIRQSVALLDLNGNEQYGWTPVLGKGQFALVTEMPSQYPAPNQWQARSMSAPPPLPPHYPPSFRFLKKAALDTVMTDSFISLAPRLTYSIQVVLTLKKPYMEVRDEALAELSAKGWEARDGKAVCGLRLTDARFGLVAMGIEMARDQTQPEVQCLVRLSYSYRDNMHSPRIE